MARIHSDTRVSIDDPMVRALIEDIPEPARTAVRKLVYSKTCDRSFRSGARGAGDGRRQRETHNARLCRLAKKSPRVHDLVEVIMEWIYGDESCRPAPGASSSALATA